MQLQESLRGVVGSAGLSHANHPLGSALAAKTQDLPLLRPKEIQSMRLESFLKISTKLSQLVLPKTNPLTDLFKWPKTSLELSAKLVASRLAFQEILIDRSKHPDHRSPLYA
jgi:hypothetical protein